MKDDPYFRMFHVARQRVSKYAENADRLAYEIFKLLEGNDPEDAAELIHELGYTDENGEWIYSEDEE